MNESIFNYAINYQADYSEKEILNQIKQKDNFEEISNFFKTKFKPIYTKNQIQDNNELFFSEYFTLKDIIYYYKANLLRKNQTITTSPLYIPITLNNKGYESQVIGIGTRDNTYIVSDIIITSGSIALETYAHEITHTQQNVSFYDNEIIPIFIELLAADYYNNQSNNIFRLNTLYTYLNELLNSNINFKEKAKNIQYIEGTLKAYLLYHLYKTESLSSSKARIIDEINNLFNQNITLTDILKNHDITNNNYKKLILEHKII